MNEEQRLAALARLSVFSHAVDREFDAITRAVASRCDVPIALVSFVGKDEQRFATSGAFRDHAIDRDASFCAHAISEHDRILLVEDARVDPRFHTNILVTGEPFIRFYAGAPLVTREGAVLGTLCVIDQEPRTLTSLQDSALRDGASAIVSLLEYRAACALLEASPSPSASAMIADPYAEEIPASASEADMRLAEAMRASPMLPFEIIDTIPGIFFMFTAAGKYLLWNKRFEDLNGYSADEISAMHPLQSIAPEDRDHVTERIRQTFLQGSATAEASVISKTGIRVPHYFTGSLVEFQGEPCLAGIGLDISGHRRIEEMLSHTALHDALTGLENRAALSARIARSARTARESGGQLAVLFVNIDLFKNFNDSYGHRFGDELLYVVAQRLRAAARADDSVVRFGGDEFVIVADIGDETAITPIFDAVRSCFNHPVSVGGQTLHLTSSVGIAMYPADGSDEENVVRNADTAMNRAKELGRNGYRFYTPAIHEAAAKRFALEKELRRALQHHEFELYLQPSIDILSGRTLSAEALIRWNHPTKGLIMPGAFIEVAEQSDLIVEIGAWVLLEGARLAKSLSDEGRNELYLTLNVSARQLMHANFLDHIKLALFESGAPPYAIGLEITESAALGDPDHVREILRHCKELGFRILLDDFGTSYSSLTYLKKFPIDIIKIDKSFVDGLPDDNEDRGIVEAIVALGRSLRCDVLAEGIEHAAQEQWLLGHGCSYVTGYHYSRPLTVAAFEEWMQRPETPYAGAVDVDVIALDPMNEGKP